MSDSSISHVTLVLGGSCNMTQIISFEFLHPIITSFAIQVLKVLEIRNLVTFFLKRCLVTFFHGEKLLRYGPTALLKHQSTSMNIKHFGSNLEGGPLT